MTERGRATQEQLDERLVVELGTAFQQRAVYPSGHPQLQRSVERAFKAHHDWIAAAGADEVSVLVVEDQLLVDRRPLPEDSIWRKGLMQSLARHHLGGMTLSAQLTPEELEQFLDSCFAASGPAATRHVQFGTVRPREGAGGELGATGAGSGRPEGEALAGGFAAEEMSAAGEELLAVASGITSRLERLRGLVTRLARTAAAARHDPAALAGLRVSDPSLGHGLETSMGALRLGRALGASGDVLEELGLAGLLHDVGYLEPAAAAESFDDRRQNHALRGALRLAAMDGLPESVVLAAYEHHLRWDGAENYPRLSAPRRPAGPARVVAVADSWATLRSRGGATPVEAAAILRDRAGSFLDPELVTRFLVGLAE